MEDAAYPEVAVACYPRMVPAMQVPVHPELATLAVPVLAAVLYRLVPVPGAVLHRVVPVPVVKALLQAMSTLSWNQLPTIPGAE